MKKYGIFAAVLVLTLTLLTGCRNPNVAPTELPPTSGATMAPTTEATTVPTTLPTTVPPTDMTGTTEDSASTESGTGSDTTEATAGARSGMGSMK